MKKVFKLSGTLAVVAIAIALVDCGGGGSSQPVVQQTVPPPLAITTTSLAAGFYSEFYSVTLQATGGTGARSWSISSGVLPQGLNLDHASGVISGIITDAGVSTTSLSVTVQDAASHVATKSFDLSWSTRAPKILTTSLPDAFVGSHYRVVIATTQPSATLQKSASSGPLPPGLTLNGQVLEGDPTTPTPPTTYPFTLEILDSTNAVADQRAFTIVVKGAGSGSGNDSIGTATPLSNGTYSASISPFVDPTTSLTPMPDQDYYKLIVQPGNVVSIQIASESLGTPFDSVIELVDSSGNRMGTCDSPGQSGLISSCLNDDDAEEGTHDSKLLFKNSGSAAATVFLHVLDWRGDARPDMQYQLQIFGAD